MTGRPSDPAIPPSIRRSLAAAALRGGAVGMLAGVSGGGACWLALFVWDSVEEGRLVNPASESLWPAVALVVLGVAVAIPLWMARTLVGT